MRAVVVVVEWIQRIVTLVLQESENAALPCCHAFGNSDDARPPEWLVFVSLSSQQSRENSQLSVVHGKSAQTISQQFLRDSNSSIMNSQQSLAELEFI